MHKNCDTRAVGRKKRISLEINRFMIGFCSLSHQALSVGRRGLKISFAAEFDAII